MNRRIALTTLALTLATTARWSHRRRRRRRRSSPRSRPATVRSIGCGSGRSVRPRRRDASTISRCSRAIRRRSTSRWRRRASTRRPTPARPSRRSSTTRAAARSARSRSRRPTRTWCGSAPAKRNNRQSSSWGDGIYKSTDGGRSWKNMGLATSKQIARIIVDPVDFNVVYVAVARRSVGRRRRARRLQDDRRRRDVESRAARRRRHRRDRAGDGSVEQQDALHRDLSAAPPAVGHERRRPRQQHLEDHRRRRDVGEARIGHSGRTEGPHRPRRLPPQSERRSTPRVEHETESGVYRIRQRRRDLAEDERRPIRGRCTSA